MLQSLDKKLAQLMTPTKIPVDEEEKVTSKHEDLVYRYSLNKFKELVG